VLYSPPDAVQGQVIAGSALALCSQVAHTPAIGHCPPGAQVVWLTGALDSHKVTSRSSVADRVWRAAAISPGQLHGYPTRGIVVETNGSSSALERTRTTLELAFPNQTPPLTLSEITGANAQTVTELQQLTNIVILVSLVVAGCSLAITVTAGVVDRKRPFSLLRLTGVPINVLRRVVALEAGVPLLAIAVIAGTLGFLGAGLFLSSQLGETLRPPNLQYYLLVGGGLLASLGIIASTFPLIERITGLDVARNE
jgi:predicted lysophospholipase L1 biosynthesis ABC-type transport system permease subunit